MNEKNESKHFAEQQKNHKNKTYRIRRNKKAKMIKRKIDFIN